MNLSVPPLVLDQKQMPHVFIGPLPFLTTVSKH